MRQCSYFILTLPRSRLLFFSLNWDLQEAGIRKLGENWDLQEAGTGSLEKFGTCRKLDKSFISCLILELFRVMLNWDLQEAGSWSLEKFGNCRKLDCCMNV